MEYIGTRISFLRKPDELSIVISAYADKGKSSLLLAWILAWTLGGIAMAVYLFQVHETQLKTMILVWMGFWLYFEYKAWKAYTWRRFGKEIIKIGKGHLFYKRDNRGAGKIQNFETESVQQLGRYAGGKNDLVSSFVSSYWVIAGETLSFNYFGKETAVGLELDEKDANALLHLLRAALH
ncbi:MAG TPA: hypothetical protein VNZ86_19525 [Bacteroidia bacterium]|jgi:hypothetical protein|nr:hypothetical protein [Bacteroidia bacterium]